jgi:hypothetical protein
MVVKPTKCFFVFFMVVNGDENMIKTSVNGG